MSNEMHKGPLSVECTRGGLHRKPSMSIPTKPSGSLRPLNLIKPASDFDDAQALGANSRFG